MPLAANMTDSDLDGFPRSYTKNLDGTIATVTVTVTDILGGTEQWRKTYTYDTGVIATASAWVKL